MNKSSALSSEQLYSRCDPDQFSFQTTAELDSIDVVIGQQRALDSVRFGLRISSDGYNIFALGPGGMGKFTAVRHMVAEEAKTQPVPDDWCYVYNFARAQQPDALKLPAGRGKQLQQDMVQLVEELSSAIPAAFESDDYRLRIEELEHEFKERQSDALEALSQHARTQHIALLRTPAGFAFAPMSDGDEVLKPEQFKKLSVSEQQRIEADIEKLQQELQKIMRQAPAWAKETREKTKQLNREIAEFAVSHPIETVQARYRDLTEVADYLKTVEQDIVDNVNVFLPQAENPALPVLQNQRASQLQRYQVNLLVDNSALDHAPVIFEDLPSHNNLIGCSEYQAQMGTLVTDFSLIKAGALHRANGGYLVLDARQVMLQPFAWDGLKRALQTRQIRLDSLQHNLSLISTVSIEPEHIPLDVKVVLVGDRQLYYLLSRHDPDFHDLFKVMADFDETMERNPQTSQIYARLFATVAQHHQLRALERDAVARLIEHSARLAGDAEKTSTHLRSIADLLQEADHWAASAGRNTISSADIQHTIDQQIYRAERIRERVYENIRRGTVLIDTDGSQVGQINGLSVLQLDHFAFGQPARITATTRLGSGRMIDIERETELGGSLHSKGVLILSSYLAARYAAEQPLSVAASLVFEQSYGMVEGDSASLAELCALLSSLSGLAIKQCFAVTGSVNQHGQVQPIGGVNEKIEGFFDICNTRGLSGEHSVIIPATNIKHLMLKHEVVQAAADGQFHVYAVSTVDQAIELLTGQSAGERSDQGIFPAESVNARIEARLSELSRLRQSFGERSEKEAATHD